MMENLNMTDIDILVEALTAWEHKEVAGDMMTSLLTATLIGNDPQLREKCKQEADERKLKGAKALQGRQETSILLKAKLIGIKNVLEADHLVGNPDAN